MQPVDEIESKLEKAKREYERGDFTQARKLSRELLEDKRISGDIKHDAKRILAATGIDPAAVIIFLVTGALLAYLVIRFIL